MTTFPTEFSALPTVNGSTKVLADDGTNNGTATVAQIVANAGPDTRIPTSGNTAGNVPAFTSTGGQLGASPISVAGSSIVINSDGNAAFVFRGITNPNNNIYVGYDSAGNYGRIQAITEGTALRPLALNPDGGNVGIGTTSPGAKLDVRGSVAAWGNGGYSLGWGDTSDLGRLTYTGGIPSITTSGAATPLDFAINYTSAMRIDASGNVGIGTASPTDLLDVNSDAMRLRSSKTPASSSAAGNAGEMCWDASYLYVCVATNTWRRVAHSSW